MGIKQPFLQAVMEWEQRGQAAMHKPHPAVLRHLHSSFVQASPKSHKDSFYSTLFNYLVIDILAHHHDIGQNLTSKGHTAVPASTHLVRSVI